MHRWLFLVLFAVALQARAQTPPASPAAAKRVEIDKTRQTLRADEGDRLVLKTRIGAGKWDKSPLNGQFEAGDKLRMHYSKLLFKP